MDDIHRALLGNLSLKSSVLRTKGENLTNQFMVASNMLSHYNKLQRVKPTVDNRPPKSMLFSTKARDQRLRSLNKNNNQAVLAIKAVLSVKNPNLGYLSPTVDSQKLDGRSIIKSKPAEAEPTDLLDLHPHKFTPRRAFQPRTNRTDHSSKLSQLKVYNPPLRAKSANRASRPTSSSRSSINSARSQMSPKAHHGDEARVNVSDVPNAKSQRLSSLTRTTFDDMTLISLASTSPDLPANFDIPPLDISVDKDNRLWQKMLSDRRSNKSGVESINGKIDQKYIRQSGKENGNIPMSSISFSTNDMETSDLKSLEEDCKYIEFLQEVTEDVIRKGSYTNKVLTKIFEYHIDKNAHELKESRMREMLNQLRMDLGISHDELDLTGELQTSCDLNLNSPKRLKKKPSKLTTSTKIHQTNNHDNKINENHNSSHDPLNSSQSTNRSKASKSSKRSKNKREMIHEETSDLKLNESTTNESMENVREWLNNNNNNESGKKDSLSEHKSNKSLKENKSESKHQKTESKNDDNYDYDYDDDDTTIASVSSLDDNYQDTKDLLEYYNSTVSDDPNGPHSNNNRIENGFNRTSLSDIPEMSYRSEMVKQMSVNDNNNNLNPDRKNESPNDKQPTVSGHEGDSSSRISSSRSRRRAKMAEMNSGRPNVVDSVEPLSLKDDSNVDDSVKSDRSKKSTVKNAVRDDVDESRKDKRSDNDDVKSKSGDYDDEYSHRNKVKVATADSDDDVNNSHKSTRISNSPDLRKDKNEIKFRSLKSVDEDASEDDIEEECSIPIDYSSDEGATQSGRKIMKEDDF